MGKQLVLNIRPLRQQQGMTQAELAALLNIEQSRVSAYETGRQSPPVHRLPAIAQALRVDVGQLFAQSES
jgi:transcriptional regulator with XRE-family HTH domain